jgi:pyruvate kinase
MSGDTARLCSKYRPSVPIITVTRNLATSRAAHLSRGVYPCLYPKPKPTDSAHWQEDVDARLKWGMKQAIDLGLISAGDAVIAVQGWTGGLGHSNTLRA